MKAVQDSAKRGRLSGKACRRVVAIALLLALIASLIPLYTLARYSYAGVDDYRYGLTTHAVWAETRSLGKTLAEAGRVAAETYAGWQGSIAAVFLMALQPGIFGSGCYGLSTALLLSVLVLSILCFVTTACRAVFCTDADSAYIVALLAAICCVQFVPAPVESFYWFNGGVYYTFFFSLSLLGAALLLRRTVRKTAFQCVCLPLLAILIGLGNLITGLLCCVLLAAYAILAHLLHKRDPLLWALLAVLLGAFLCNVFSPGNDVRQTVNAHRALSAFPAMLSAIADAFRYAGQWLRTPAPFLCLLPVPLFWRMAEGSAIRFRRPLLVTLASVLLLAAGFTPNEYALGFAGEARIMDIQYYMFVLLLMLNVLWYTGWAKRRLRISARAMRSTAAAIVAVSAIAACAITLATRNSVTAGAILAQTGGKAQAYADGWERRLAVLRDPSRTDVVLPKLDYQPPLLCMVDIASSDAEPFYFFNEQLAAYYGKNTVLREP